MSAGAYVPQVVSDTLGVENPVHAANSMRVAPLFRTAALFVADAIKIATTCGMPCVGLGVLAFQ